MSTQKLHVLSTVMNHRDEGSSDNSVLGKTLLEQRSLETDSQHQPFKTDKIMEHKTFVTDKMSKIDSLLGNSKEAKTIKDSYLKMLINSNTEFGLKTKSR